MSAEHHIVSFDTELNVEPAYTELRRLQTALFKSLGMVKRASGSEDLNKFIADTQKAIRIANQLRLTLAALQAARMASGDPLAWAMAAISVGEFAFSAGDMIMDAGS